MFFCCCSKIKVYDSLLFAENQSYFFEKHNTQYSVWVVFDGTCIYFHGSDRNLHSRSLHLKLLGNSKSLSLLQWHFDSPREIPQREEITFTCWRLFQSDDVLVDFNTALVSLFRAWITTATEIERDEWMNEWMHFMSWLWVCCVVSRVSISTRGSKCSGCFQWYRKDGSH